MKRIKLITFCAFWAMLIVASSCKKIDIPITNTIEVSLINNGATNITGNVTLSPGATFALDYVVNCPSEMEYVYVYKNGTEVAKDKVLTDKTTFSASKTFTADVAAGVYTYRILAKDKAGIYLGEKNVVVTVTADFYYYTNQVLFVPDTVDKTNPTYYISKTNKSFSFSTIGTNKTDVDFGYFYDPSILSGSTAKGHTIYALNITPLPSPITMNDISGFTKNATLLKLVTAPTFANVTSSSALQTAGTSGASSLASGTSTSINSLSTGKLVMFKTVGGKYGIINVNYVNQNSAARGTFINFDVKIQK